MHETLKLEQTARVSQFTLKHSPFDVYAQMQDQLVREALHEVRKNYPDKMVTSIAVDFVSPRYGSMINSLGNLDKWWDCRAYTTIAIADSPVKGMFIDEDTI